MAGTSADKLALLQATKDDLKAALTEKGQAPGDVFAEYPNMVRAIETGTQLPELTSPGAAADLRQGKQLIDQEGNVVDGGLVDVEQAMLAVSVSGDGLITASAQQAAGYVAAGTERTTLQLTSQAGKTVTPGTSAQTAVASGRYTAGDVIVEGDANLVPENIKSGVSIFGVAGSAPSYTLPGFTETYTEDDTDFVSVDLDAETITFKPNEALAEYGLANITGVDNIAIRLYENDDPYHEILFSKIGAASTAAYNRWLYCRWSGYASPQSANATLEHIDHGSFDYTYDETTGELVISGCDCLYKLTEGAFNLSARITWDIV